MNTSTPCTDLLSALLAARLAFPPITRNCEAWSPKSKKTYPYADLNAILDATVPVLGAHGVLLVQAPEDGEAGMLCVTTTLFHVTSGQWMRSAVSVERPVNPQEAGSAITYLKRYGVAALLSLSTEDDDAASLNGSSKPEPSAAADTLRPSVPVSTNGHTPAPAASESLEHPTEAHLAALRKLAVTVCMDEPEVFEDRMRRAMGVPKQASVAPRLLVKTMSMQAYMEVYGWYVKLEHQLAKSKEAPDGPQPASTQSAEATATPAPAPEPSPDDAAERDRVRLRAEVATWNLRISDQEREHVIQHNGYSRARQLLWKTRVDAPVATPIEVAAD